MGTKLATEHETLLKQATSMMIALRQVSGILWKISDTLMDEGMQHDRTEMERHGRLLAMEGIDAIAGVLRAGALEEKQHCGHERRFIVTGDDHDIDPQGQSDRGQTGWCALCALEGRKKTEEWKAIYKSGELEYWKGRCKELDTISEGQKWNNAALRAALKNVANALADTMTTLDSVDPNAPSLEAAEIVMKKHINIVGPLIEEARKEG